MVQQKRGVRKKAGQRDPVSMGRATRMIDQAIPKAAAVLIDLLESDDASIRLKAAKALLNKRIPDVTKQEFTGDLNFVPVKIIGHDE